MRESSNPGQTQADPDERYSKAFSVSPDAITVTDLATGRYLDVNASFERLFGYQRDALVGRTSTEIGIWADPNDRARLIDVLKSQGVVKDFLAVTRRADGALRTCNLAGAVIAADDGQTVVLVVHDITEQLATERALRQAADRYAKLFHSSPDAVAVTELHTGRLVEFNDNFLRIFGYDRESAIGRTTLEMGLWAESGEREALVDTLEQIGVIRDAEFTLVRRDSARINVLMSGEVIEFNGVDCMLTVVRDVTLQRQARQREAELEDQLRRVQKLEALGTLAGGVAHDFNNILTAILAYTEFTLMDTEDSFAVKQNLVEVRKAALRARDLVKQILAFSRRQKQERAPIDLRAPVREALTLLRSTLPSTIQIEDHFPPEPLVVMADSGQMHQVVMNLCTNAAHAIGGRPGRLRVALDVVVPPPVGSGIVSADGGKAKAMISVKDDGSGMDEQVLKRIFEPFFTTKEPGEGTGLGLSVVHGIVQAHEGTIVVDSKQGVGTEFRIQLPLRDGAVDRRAPSIDAMPRGAGQRILVIDDEEPICELAQRFLVRLGYQVTAHTNPAAALEAFVEDPPPFDLVLTDFTMPLLTGVDVARRVTGRHPEIPVLLMSGYAGAWTTQDLRDAGIRLLINKPLALSILAAAVRDALSGEDARRV
ncbi:blue-light-activated protein [mine drainage metagenome]|uniref:Blue-light-activated protein n=1 Tax=mine drainage metagenome TaxID=410659 RepID=A0A1J5SI89_9ZZZZ